MQGSQPLAISLLSRRTQTAQNGVVPQYAVYGVVMIYPCNDQQASELGLFYTVLRTVGLVKLCIYTNLATPPLPRWGRGTINKRVGPPYYVLQGRTGQFQLIIGADNRG